MKNNYTRKKAPEKVKQQLLAATAAQAVEHGLMAITLDKVAKQAGVSKGGLLHHFPNKQLLITGLFKQMLSSLSEQINTLIEQDSEPTGCFTRAYLIAVTSSSSKDAFESRLLGAVSLAMSTETYLANAWAEWVLQEMHRHQEDANSTQGQLIRFAADGIWLEACIGGTHSNVQSRDAVIKQLIAMTYQI